MFVVFNKVEDEKFESEVKPETEINLADILTKNRKKTAQNLTLTQYILKIRQDAISICHFRYSPPRGIRF